MNNLAIAVGILALIVAGLACVLISALYNIVRIERKIFEVQAKVNRLVEAQNKLVREIKHLLS